MELSSSLFTRKTILLKIISSEIFDLKFNVPGMAKIGAALKAQYTKWRLCYFELFFHAKSVSRKKVYCQLIFCRKQKYRIIQWRITQGKMSGEFFEKLRVH